MNNSYNFDNVVDRHDTCATKIEEMDRKFGRHDLLPFWIADMDFEACPCIIDALRRRLDHAVLGYTSAPADFGIVSFRGSIDVTDGMFRPMK